MSVASNSEQSKSVCSTNYLHIEGRTYIGVVSGYSSNHQCCIQLLTSSRTDENRCSECTNSVSDKDTDISDSESEFDTDTNYDYDYYDSDCKSYSSDDTASSSTQPCCDVDSIQPIVQDVD
jgi:hypothetical protein